MTCSRILKVGEVFVGGCGCRRAADDFERVGAADSTIEEFMVRTDGGK
jgi:hypothetical protein